MFQSLDTVDGWVQEFANHLKEEYGVVSAKTDRLLQQLKEVLEAFDKSSILAMTDAKGTIIAVNDTFCELSGYSRKELIGNNHRILKSNYHTPSFYEDMWKTITSGNIWVGEIKNRNKQGVYYWVKTTIYPIIDTKGKPQRFISIRTDISEGKKHEEVLREVIEEDYTRVLKNLQNLVMRTIWSQSEGAIITLLEGKLAEELGLNTASTHWRPVVEVLGDEEQAPILKQRFRKAFAGTAISFDFKHNQQYLHASLSPVLNENSEVKEVIASISDITDLKTTELAVRRMAYTNPLTKLPNHRMLEEDLVYQILDGKMEQKKVSLIIIDLDEFKNINDTLGHSVGDQFIIMAAKRLQTVRYENYFNKYKLYHVGGDEFILVLYGFEDAHLQQIVQSISQLFEKPFHYMGGEFYQGASIGVSVYPDSANHAEDLMKHANMALYASKQHGGQRYQFFNMNLKGLFLSKIQMESDLRSAAKSCEQFELFYQPIIRGENKKIVSCEALIRWNHRKKGMISPIEFISLAEETGLIIPIGDWVIRQACYDLKRWNKSFNEQLMISINLSAYQLQQTGFVEKLASIMEEEDMSPKQIQLEITENSLMENTNESINTLKQLRKSGFTLAIDDFGTGYSSLSYLKQFPVHCLKMDKSFVRDLPKDQVDQAIVSSMVKLGKDLGLSIVAEGVESKEAYNYLTSIGCPLLQGFYFSKPLPVNKFEKLVKDINK